MLQHCTGLAHASCSGVDGGWAARPIEKGDGFVVSADIWTSGRGHSFLGIVASFIDGTFRGHTVLLSCDLIKGHHTADRIYHMYESVLKYWNVEGRVIRVVTDNASNMVKAFNLFPVTEEEDELIDHDEHRGCQQQQC